jgi:hypothetical protein
MKTDADVSLESDDLEGDLAKGAAPPPVVVVQYRKRGIPSWIAFPTILAVPLISIMIYHRLVVEPYRGRAAEAERVLEAWIKTPRPVAPAPAPVPVAGATPNASPVSSAANVPSVASGAPAAAAKVEAPAAPAAPPTPPSFTPAVSTSDPLPGSGQPSLTQAPTTPANALSPANPAAGAAANVAASGTPAPSKNSSQPQTGAPVQSGAADPRVDSPAGGSAPKPPAATPALAALERAQNSAIPPSFETPFDTAKDQPTDATGAPRTGGVRTRGLGLEAAQPNEVPGENGHRIAADGSRQEDRQPPVVRDIQPLPTKEESLRAIAEEAARKQAEILESRTTRQVEIRSRRYEERVKFREELREILRVHGNKAGDEIDRLARRHGYEADSDEIIRVDRIWRGARLSQQAKVRMIRSLDVPEVVLLDKLSDNLAGKVNTRDGPRNENDVRVRAARQLLSYDLPPLEEINRLAPPATQERRPPRAREAARPALREGPPR